jgi:hypothetical protein
MTDSSFKLATYREKMNARLDLVATEVLRRWEKKRKKEYRGARPWSRLGPAGPL